MNTASTLSGGKVVASPRSQRTPPAPGLAAATARLAAAGSTAVTSIPRRARAQANVPVPQPMSSTTELRAHRPSSRKHQGRGDRDQVGHRPERVGGLRRWSRPRQRSCLSHARRRRCPQAAGPSRGVGTESLRSCRLRGVRPVRQRDPQPGRASSRWPFWVSPNDEPGCMCRHRAHDGAFTGPEVNAGARRMGAQRSRSES